MVRFHQGALAKPRAHKGLRHSFVCGESAWGPMATKLVVSNHAMNTPVTTSTCRWQFIDLVVGLRRVGNHQVSRARHSTQRAMGKRVETLANGQVHPADANHWRPLDDAHYRTDEVGVWHTPGNSLLPRVVLQRLAVGRENLEMVEAGVHA